MNLGDPDVRVVRSLSTDDYPWCTHAVLIEIQNGRGVLWRATKAVSGETYENDQAIMVNDVPIIRSKGPVCPTCERMLATGYGVERAESGELRQIADKINEPYQGFDDAVQRIVPVLGLLADGLYAVVEAELYPTDGNGHFFWDVPNGFTFQPATAPVWICNDDYSDLVGEMPAYVYPSQKSVQMHAHRVSRSADSQLTPPR